MKILAAIVFVGVLAASGSNARAFDALITDCHDGDTCTAVADGDRFHIRLHGIDAPELDQPYGMEARAVMVRLVAGRHVDLTAAGRSYNRLVADVRLLDGSDVGELLVAAGAAWVEPRYSVDPKAPGLQATAQQRHLGLWANPSAIPPWEWRHVNRPNHLYSQTER